MNVIIPGLTPCYLLQQLTRLDHTLREGNNVISDPAVHPRAFDWQAAFPD
jgi:hypothetical protein